MWLKSKKFNAFGLFWDRNSISSARPWKHCWYFFHFHGVTDWLTDLWSGSEYLWHLRSSCTSLYASPLTSCLSLSCLCSVSLCSLLCFLFVFFSHFPSSHPFTSSFLLLALFSFSSFRLTQPHVIVYLSHCWMFPQQCCTPACVKPLLVTHSSINAIKLHDGKWF